MAKDNDMIMRWGFEPDQKTQAATKKSFENMISLIADLSIIGKVATDVVSGIWSAMKEGISVGLDAYKDMNLGMTLGIDPGELEKLKFVMGQIGTSGQDTMKILTQVNEYIRAFDSPQTGAEEIKKMYEKLATYGVSKEQSDEIVNAIKEGDPTTIIKELSDTRNELGDRFSDFVNHLDVGGLAPLENDMQWEDFNKALNITSSHLFNIDSGGLNDLENGMAMANTALRQLAIDLGGMLGEPIEQMGETMLDWTKSYLEWKDKGGWGNILSTTREWLDEHIPKVDENRSIAGWLLESIKEANATRVPDYDAITRGRSGYGDDPYADVPKLDLSGASGGAKINVSGDLNITLPESGTGSAFTDLLGETNKALVDDLDGVTGNVR